MSIRVICSECHAELEVSEAAAGKKGRCPTCQAVMEIPRADGGPAPSPAETGAAIAGNTVLVHCPDCGLQLEVSSASAGRKGRCPQCRALMSIPRNGEDERATESAADMIVVTCQKCDTQLQVSASSAGKMGRCPHCRSVMPIPAKLEPAKQAADPAALPAETAAMAAFLADAAPQETVAARSTAAPAPARRIPPQIALAPAASSAPVALEKIESLISAEPQVPASQSHASQSPSKPSGRAKTLPPVILAPPALVALKSGSPSPSPPKPPGPAPTKPPATPTEKPPAPPPPKPPATVPQKPPVAPAAKEGDNRWRPAVPGTTPPVSQAEVEGAKGSSSQPLDEQILAAFVGQIARTPPSPMYKLGILLTTGVMIVVPLIYLSFIFAVGLLVVWHLAANVGMLTAISGRGQFLAVVAYLAPAVIGILLVLFMVKPLFAPSGDHEKTRTLTRDAEPLLFAFVERVCATVNAPVPKQIEVCCDVNAGARLESFGGGGLVLQIGMPLVAGLSLQQFAGVLAHEFGHFSQGAGMRLTYLTRRIDLWLIRVVYERDRWDDWLETAAGSVHLAIGWVLHLLRFLVWGTRWILRLLLYVGHAATGFMLREMEYDADRFEARLAGSQTFEATVRQLIYLNFAYRGAQADLENFFRDGRLADNLPRLIIANIAQLPDEARKAADEMIEHSETGIFDSHPADRDRITSARAENATGVFQSRLPAAVLFQDFDSLAKAVTWDLYTEMFGTEFKPTAVRPIEEMLERQSREDQIYDAMKRFLLDSFQVLRPLRVPEWYLRPPTNVPQVQDQLASARNQMHSQIAAYNQAWEWYDKADSHVVQMRQLIPLMRCGARIMTDKFEHLPANAETAGYERDRAYADMHQLDGQLVPLETAAGQRLYAALWLLHDPPFAARLDDAPELLDHCQRLLPLVGRINGHLGQINELRFSGAILAALAGHIDDNDKNEGLFQEIIDQLHRSHRQLFDVWTIFQREAYPFDHHEGFMSISQFLLKELPRQDELGGTLDGIDLLLGNLASIYRRSLARLCYIAERVETALGWEPLTLPQKTT